jgi:hypothetical protein
MLSVYSEARTASMKIIEAGKLKVEEVQNEAQEYDEILQNAIATEAENQCALESAINQLSESYSDLEDAETNLSYCESIILNIDEYNFGFSDCYYEENSVHTARGKVSEFQTDVAVKEKEYEYKRYYREKMDLKNEMMHHCLDKTIQTVNLMESECHTILNALNEVIEVGKRRLESAKSELMHYLDSHPEAQNFYKWLYWEPEKNKPITPSELNSRLNLTFHEQTLYFDYLIERDPVFRKKIEGYRNILSQANGEAEKLVVQLKVRRNLSGYYGEKVVEMAFGALGQRINTQGITITEDDRYTKTDIVLENLKVPVILGRGEGRYAPVGGSIAIEVKFGKASYIYAQKDHMIFQTQGHRSADASMTICSRDIKNLSEKREREIRDALSESGSPLIGMLPAKDEIDQALWNLVTAQDHFKE